MLLKSVKNFYFKISTFIHYVKTLFSKLNDLLKNFLLILFYRVFFIRVQFFFRLLLIFNVHLGSIFTYYGPSVTALPSTELLFVELLYSLFFLTLFYKILMVRCFGIPSVLYMVSSFLNLFYAAILINQQHKNFYLGFFNLDFREQCQGFDLIIVGDLLWGFGFVCMYKFYRLTWNSLSILLWCRYWQSMRGLFDINEFFIDFIAVISLKHLSSSVYTQVSWTIGWLCWRKLKKITYFYQTFSLFTKYIKKGSTKFFYFLKNNFKF